MHVVVQIIDISFMFDFLLGIYDEAFAVTLMNSSFFDQLSDSDNKMWKELYILNVTSYFNRSLIGNIAQPILKMLR